MLESAGKIPKSFAGLGPKKPTHAEYSCLENGFVGTIISLEKVPVLYMVVFH